jgi:hypothetical protein
MFNTYHAGNCTNNIKINAVTGAILKNHPKSWFERFHLQSTRAEKLLCEGGHKYTHYYSGAREPDKDITVLQMVICGDMEVMAELIYTKDYEGVIYDKEVVE